MRRGRARLFETDRRLLRDALGVAIHSRSTTVNGTVQRRRWGAPETP